MLVASDREHDVTKTVMPTEYARGLHIKNAPSLQALKLLHLMIGSAGGRMADNVRHEIRLADIKHIDGMNNHTKESLRPLFEELSCTLLVYDEPERKRWAVGGFIDHAEVDYQHEVSGDTLITWRFGHMFKELAKESDHWAILDRQTVFHLGSRYAVLLFQHISSLTPLKHIQSKVFSVADLRDVFGIEAGKIKRFSSLNQYAIRPAIAAINELSRFTLTATPRKIGRTVASVEISWEPKPEVLMKPLGSPEVGRKTRRDATEETPSVAFPATGSIEFSKPWNDIARINGNGKDKDLIANDFRNWCNQGGIPLDKAGIEKTFTGFCKRARV